MTSIVAAREAAENARYTASVAAAEVVAAEAAVAAIEAQERTRTAPAGTEVHEFTSHYYGSHPERGYDDEIVYVAVPAGMDVSVVEFQHGSGYYGHWTDTFRTMPGAWYWDESAGEIGAWVTGESMFFTWGDA